MRTAVVIPVRLASTRLPGKALLEIQGRSAIEHLIDRVNLARRPDLIVLCTTTRPEDAVFAGIARRNGIQWFAGNERDILGRFLDAATAYGVEFLVAADGDDPFKDPTFIDKVIERGETTGADFITCEGLPYGVASHGIPVAVLRRVCDVKLEEDTETGWGGYFTETGLFRVETVEAPAELRAPHLRMTLDYPEDYRFFQEVFSRLYRPGEVFPLQSVLELLRQEPWIAEINAGVHAAAVAHFGRGSGVRVRPESECRAGLSNGWSIRGHAGGDRRVLIVGLGSMGKRRIRNLLALGTENIWGWDIRLDRREEAERKCGIAICEDLETALAQRPDAMVISTPPDAHLPYAVEAAKRGIPFFVEASVVEEGLDDLITLCRQRPGLVAAPSCTMRYFPGPRKVLAFLEQAAIGRPMAFTYQSGQYLPDWHPWEDYREFYASRRKTGGCREMVPFELVWLCHAFGPVAAVTAHVTKVSDLDADIDDLYQVLLEFQSGLMGCLQVDILSRAPIRQLRLLGTEGTLEWDNEAKTVRLYRAADRAWTTHPLEAGTPEPPYMNQEEPYIEEMREFLDAVRGIRSFPYTLDEDRQILRVLAAIERSAETGRKVLVGGSHELAQPVGE